MTKDDGAVQDKVADAAALPVVYVAAANSCLRNMYADFVLVAQLRYFAVLECDILYCTKDESRVLKNGSVSDWRSALQSSHLLSGGYGRHVVF